MDKHQAFLRWKRETPDFTYQTYDRNHIIRFSGGEEVKVSASPAYLGDSKLANPEELLLGAVSSCFMLTFLALAVKFGYTVNQYDDDATCTLDKNAEGLFYVNEITLKPKVTFDPQKLPDEKTKQTLFEKAHKHCFISNTVCSKINIEPQ